MKELLKNVAFLTNGTGSVKFTRADIELIENKWGELTGTSEPLNFREFFLKVVDKALKPADSKESLALIEKLQKEILELKEQISPNTEKIAEFDEILAAKVEEISVLTQKLSFTDDKTFVKDGQVLVDLIKKPIVLELLKLVAEKMSEKNRMVVSMSDVLIKLFFEQIKHGSGDHIPYLTSLEVKKIYTENEEKQIRKFDNE